MAWSSIAASDFPHPHQRRRLDLRAPAQPAVFSLLLCCLSAAFLPLCADLGAAVILPCKPDNNDNPLIPLWGHQAVHPESPWQPPFPPRSLDPRCADPQTRRRPEVQTTRRATRAARGRRAATRAKKRKAMSRRCGIGAAGGGLRRQRPPGLTVVGADAPLDLCAVGDRGVVDGDAAANEGERTAAARRHRGARPAGAWPRAAGGRAPRAACGLGARARRGPRCVAR